MSKELLFVYGTLLDDDTRSQVVGRDVTGNPDLLPDHAARMIEVSDQSYPCAEASKGSMIQGMTLELSGEELQKVDDYETGTYERKRAELSSGTSAWVYALPTTNQ